MLLEFRKDSEFLNKKRYAHVLKKVEQYNKLASKHGHPLIDYDKYNLTVNNIFIYKDLRTIPLSIFETAKTMFIDWILEKKYDHIWKTNLRLLEK